MIGQLVNALTNGLQIYSYSVRKLAEHFVLEVNFGPKSLFLYELRIHHTTCSILNTPTSFRLFVFDKFKSTLCNKKHAVESYLYQGTNAKVFEMLSNNNTMGC
jgi:hypothetical protein